MTPIRAPMPLPTTIGSTGENAWDDYVRAVGQVEDNRIIKAAFNSPTRLSPEAGKAVKANAKALDRARQGLDKPFTIPELELYGESGLASGGLQALPMLFLLDGRQHEAKREYSEALDCYADALRFGGQIRGTATGVARLVSRWAIERSCIEIKFSVHEGIEVDSEQLGAVIELVEEIEEMQPTARELLLREYEAAGKWLKDVLASDDPEALQFVLGLPINYTPNPQEAISQLDSFYDEAVDIASLPLAAAIKADITAPTDPLVQRCSEDPRMLSFRVARLAAGMRATRLSLAVAMFQGRNARLPEKLSDLSPDPLESIPQDPLSGSPFVYRAHEDTFLLYSIGTDGVDDGLSLVAVGYNAKGDIVF